VKKILVLVLVFAVLIFAQCGTTTNNSKKEIRIGIDEAIDLAVDEIGQKITQGNVGIVLGFVSDSEAISEYVINELKIKLTKTNTVKISEREPRGLELIRNELQFQLTGEVSDESAKRIGYMTGAEHLITGSFKELGNNYYFILKVYNIEQNLLEVAVSKYINMDDEKIVSLLQTKPLPDEKIVALSLSKQTISIPVSKEKSRPIWVDNPYAVYPKANYIVATGYGKNIEQAISEATDHLIGIFGMRIWVEDGNYRQENIMDYIIGAEIKEAWDDSKGNIYAMVIVNKSMLIEQYTRIIKENLNLIQNLVTMSNYERYTLDGYARFVQASYIADSNYNYSNIVKVCGGNISSLKLINGTEYILTAQSIIKNIPIELISENDRAGRIKTSFLSAISHIGFTNGDSNSFYTLSTKLNNENNKSYIVSAKLIEKKTGKNYFEYFITEDTKDENRAISILELKIREDFENYLFNFLKSYIPNF
jgi:hypothetical protein